MLTAGSAVLLALVFGVMTTRRGGDETIVDGYVYRGVEGHSGDYFSPVRGVLVTNDGDGSGVATDATGHFRLALPRRGADDPVKLTVRQDQTVLLRQPIVTSSPRVEINLIVPRRPY